MTKQRPGSDKGDGSRPEELVVARKEVDEAREAAARGKRKQKTWYLTQEVIERANSAAYWSLPMAIAKASIRGEDPDNANVPDSASALVESALWAEVLRLEQVFNDGKPFPPTQGKLKTGPGQAGRSRMREERGSGKAAESESVEE